MQNKIAKVRVQPDLNELRPLAIGLLTGPGQSVCIKASSPRAGNAPETGRDGWNSLGDGR